MRQKSLAILISCLTAAAVVYANPVPFGTAVMITGKAINMREEPAQNARVIAVLQKNEQVVVLDNCGDWLKVRTREAKEGWIIKSFASITRNTTSRERFPSKQISLIQNARRYMGVKYVYGGETPRGFDCSGFTSYVYEKCGYKLPRRANEQYDVGSRVKKVELAPGDLVFFATQGSRVVNHVGIFVGNGYFLHASTIFGSVHQSTLSNPYFQECYQGARRVVDEASRKQLEEVVSQPELLASDFISSGE